MKPIAIDRESDKPLYAQIRDALKQAIEGRELEPGEQLPTVAALAARIGVTQGTVRRAYEDLTKAGEVASHVGRGTFVCDPAESPAPDGTGRPASPPIPVAVDAEFKKAAQRLRRGIAKSLENLMALNQRPGLIRFAAGVPSSGSLREGLMEELVLDALKMGQDRFGSCGDSLGWPDLRAVLAERLSRPGRPVTPEQILITSGSQQAVSLIAQAAMEDGRRVICETPCYTGVPNAFTYFGHLVDTVPRDREGPMIEHLAQMTDSRPSLLYLCPEMHNPMGTDLSPDRGRMLTEWAGEQRALVVLDEIFRDLRFEGPPPTGLVENLGPEQAVVIGSISKSFTGGLRIGWLVSTPEMAGRLAAVKRSMDLGCPALTQGVALSLLRTGEYDRHTARLRAQYRERRDAVIQALERYMPEGVSWTTPVGGFNMWVELPEGYSSIGLFLTAVERGVSFIPGPYMDIDHRFVNALRLSYADLEPDLIREGIELLSSAVGEVLRESPRDAGLSGLGGFL